MTTYLIAPVQNCKFCHGSGSVVEYHPYGATVAGETLICDCILEQLPEEYDEGKDTFFVDYSGPICEDGPEFEYDW